LRYEAAVKRAGWSTSRVEIAVPPKGARYAWPTYRLTDAHLIAAHKAIYGSPMTPLEKRLAKWVAEHLMRARGSALAADWQAAERQRSTRKARKR
jgi:hypothetical protein